MENFLKSIDSIVLRPRKRILKGINGNFKALGLGQSFDFHGHSPYTPGCDIRRIDWKTYMRTQNIYVKDFTEQKQIHANVIFDSSASMDFGKPSKWEIGQRIAIGLSYIILNSMNRLSLFSINEKLNVISNGIMGKKSFYGLIEDIENLKAEGKTNFKDITLNMKNFGGMTFIISDLLSDEALELLDFLSQRGEEVVVIHILSPEEINPYYGDEIKLVDKETSEIRMVKIDDKVREIYKKKLAEFIESRKRECLNRGIKYVFESTDKSIVETIFKAVEVI